MLSNILRSSWSRVYYPLLILKRKWNYVMRVEEQTFFCEFRLTATMYVMRLGFSMKTHRQKKKKLCFSSEKLGLGHSNGNEWKHICEQINFYNLCVFIRYSEANAIKWPKPILYGMRVVEQFQTVMSPLQGELKYYAWTAVWNQSAVFTSEYVWLNQRGAGNDKMLVSL